MRFTCWVQSGAFEQIWRSSRRPSPYARAGVMTSTSKVIPRSCAWRRLSAARWQATAT